MNCRVGVSKPGINPYHSKEGGEAIQGHLRIIHGELDCIWSIGLHHLQRRLRNNLVSDPLAKRNK